MGSGEAPGHPYGGKVAAGIFGYGGISPGTDGPVSIEVKHSPDTDLKGKLVSLGKAATLGRRGGISISADLEELFTYQ